jgi:hypothetical protein
MNNRGDAPPLPFDRDLIRSRVAAAAPVPHSCYARETLVRSSCAAPAAQQLHKSAAAGAGLINQTQPTEEIE